MIKHIFGEEIRLNFLDLEILLVEKFYIFWRGSIINDQIWDKKKFMTHQRIRTVDLIIF